MLGDEVVSAVKIISAVKLFVAVMTVATMKIDAAQETVVAVKGVAVKIP